MISLRGALLAVAVLACHGTAAARTVVLDTGHSPTSPGARSASGVGEYVFNLQASDKIAEELAARGINVIRTGSDGRAWSLAQRALAAAQTDLFLSVHHDSIQQAWIDQGRAGDFAGFSVFISTKNVATQASARCASALGAAMRDVGERPSLYHATPIPGENRPLIDAVNGVHRFDDLIVLKAASAPAVLLEIGVIVNPHEERKLADKRFIARYSSAVADAVARCIGPRPATR